MDTLKVKAIQALEKYNGVVSVACQAIGLARSTFYLWCKEDSEFKEAVDEINEVSIDFVENKLFELIEGVTIKGESAIYKKQPDVTAIIFYLKTKAKTRGYVEKTQIEHSGSIKTTKDLSDDELAAIVSGK